MCIHRRHRHRESLHDESPGTVNGSDQDKLKVTTCYWPTAAGRDETNPYVRGDLLVRRRRDRDFRNRRATGADQPGSTGVRLDIGPGEMSLSSPLGDMLVPRIAQGWLWT